MVSYDVDANTVTKECRVLEMKRQIWATWSMMDSGCDVHFSDEVHLHVPGVTLDEADES